MPRKFFRKYLPDATAVRGNKYVALFGSALRHPNLWHLNRDSVAGAVAIGLFSGLVPGPLQMLTAALLAVPLRRNLPVALLTTLYTNPFTIVPLYALAYGYGSLLLGGNALAPPIEPFQMDWSDWGGSLRALWGWTVALGKPLAVGLCRPRPHPRCGGLRRGADRLAHLRGAGMARAQAAARPHGMNPAAA